MAHSKTWRRHIHGAKNAPWVGLTACHVAQGSAM